MFSFFLFISEYSVSLQRNQWFATCVIVYSG
nr:MAG TPA: hypothetical protein [Caudoviricetes sp.]